MKFQVLKQNCVNSGAGCVRQGISTVPLDGDGDGAGMKERAVPSPEVCVR